ncbi:FAD:protein FMN transferase [Nakamurella antarctica]|uniref:FAD:protein FMN transferase n=1 Tax=Nakamurella antarctica TaxID=1902245 RepID=A0A3G8ZN55_9ACTN|nr:FAD:protein FMN transferase [Nakamurella antarctica]AZI58237.1 FAD:protein FMN transferase [Nakamurella antarctica]
MVWAELAQADRIFSTYRQDSDISQINRGLLHPAHAHPDVSTVLQIADEARQLTGGAFDAYANGQLDPSGVVKGWAAQKASRQLANLGVDYYLNAGGDIIAGVTDPSDPWTFGIEDPRNPGQLATTVKVGNGALATSGAAHRGAHILDPATRLPVDTGLQVSVLGKDLTWTDILATAAVVKGPEMLTSGHWIEGYQALFLYASGKCLATDGFPRNKDIGTT